GDGFSTAGDLGLSVAMGAGRMALSAGMSYAHGIGIDTDATSIFHKNADLETSATALSNASIIGEDPRNSKRVDPHDLMSEVMGVSAKTGTDANSTMEGLRHF